MSMVEAFAEIDATWGQVNKSDERSIAARLAGDLGAAESDGQLCDDFCNRARQLEEAASLMPVTSPADAVAALTRVEDELREQASLQGDSIPLQMARLTAAVNEWISSNPQLGNAPSQ